MVGAGLDSASQEKNAVSPTSRGAVDTGCWVMFTKARQSRDSVMVEVQPYEHHWRNLLKALTVAVSDSIISPRVAVQVKFSTSAKSVVSRTRSREVPVPEASTPDRTLLVHTMEVASGLSVVTVQLRVMLGTTAMLTSCV